MNKHKLKIDTGDDMAGTKFVELDGMGLMNCVRSINIDIKAGQTHQAAITLIGPQSIEVAAEIAVSMIDRDGRLGDLMTQAKTENGLDFDGEGDIDSSLATRFLELLIEQSGADQ